MDIMEAEYLEEIRPISPPSPNSNSYNRPKRSTVRCTKRQIEMLADYMFEHQDFCREEISSNLIEYRWMQLSGKLNQYGPRKNVKQWKITWRDVKSKAKNYLNRANDGHPNSTPVYQKVLKAIGHEDSVESSEKEPPTSEISSDNIIIEIINEMDPEYLEEIRPISPPTPPPALVKSQPRVFVRSTQYQLLKLADHMIENPAFKTLKPERKQQEWEKLTEKLCDYGPRKSLLQWKLTWRDLKKRVQAEYNTNDPSRLNNMSSLDKKVWKAIKASESYVESDGEKDDASNDIQFETSVECENVEEKEKSKRKIVRSTRLQLNVLVDYMLERNDFRGAEFTLQKKEQEWDKLAEKLAEFGPQKNVEQWKHCWRDLKKRAREEYRSENHPYRRSGSEMIMKVMMAMGLNLENMTFDNSNSNDGVLDDDDDDGYTNISKPGTSFADEQGNTNISKPGTSFADEQPEDILNIDLPDPPDPPLKKIKQESRNEILDEFEIHIPVSPKLDKSHTLNGVSKRTLTQENDAKDECDLYAKLLAMKLRRLPVSCRERMMYKIDGLLLRYLSNLNRNHKQNSHETDPLDSDSSL